ncbi:DUF362 domain-containing protein [Candidatus Woesearchaeota archaeon]|nr:DUF362 domain-containing protein [Candidatus Woesearchaeota archaeon]
MAKIYLIKDASSGKYEQLLEKELKGKLKPGMKVACKLHMGESKGMFSPELAKRAASVLNKLGCKPFLFDTPVNYPGNRHTAEGYLAHAAAHGFSEQAIGCPVLIPDQYISVKTAHMDVEVADVLKAADAMLVLTHVKGHPGSGFGGAIKNLAMGCASPKSKGDQHCLGIPKVVDDECTACGLCEEVCFFKAIKVGDKAVVDPERCSGCSTCVYNCPNNALASDVTFDALLAEAAFAALKLMKDKPVFYVNDTRSITKNCDCFGNPGKMIAEDVGIFMGDDIVSVEMASVDSVINQEGKDVFKEAHSHDPYLHIKEAEKLGLGKSDYDLEEA